MLNPSSNLYKAEWLDLVFKDRNKSYGAYLLRSESSVITVKAFFMVVPVFILLFAGPMIYNRLHPVMVQTDVEMKPVDSLPPLVDLQIPDKKMELPKAAPELEKVKTVKMVADISVVEHPKIEESMPTVDELKDALIGQVTQDGKAADPASVSVVGKGTENGSGTAAADNTVYDGPTVERFPEFEGGMEAWAKFIQRNLRYPAMAQEKETQGKVFVSFIVEKDGSVSNVTLIKGIGDGCDEEALRVIRKSPHWKPGQQNRQSVRVRYTMPLSFQLSL